MGESRAPVVAPIALLLILSGVGCSVLASLGDSYSAARDAAPDPIADAAVDAATEASRDDVSSPIEAASDAGAAYPAAVLADGPLLYYRLEEPAGAGQCVSEVAGSPVANVMATPTLGVAGKVGNAIGFDGVADGYLEVDGDATQFVGVSPFTLEAWVFPHASDGTYRHVFIRDTNDQGGGRNEYGVWIQNSKIGFERYCDGTGVKAVSAVVPLNTWMHVVAVYDGATSSILKCDNCGGDPECVQFCPNQALEYLDDSISTRSRKKAFTAKFKAAYAEVG